MTSAVPLEPEPVMDDHPRNPFESVRSSGILLWVIVIVVVLVLAIQLVVPKALKPPQQNLVFQAAMYAALLAWMLRQRRLGISLTTLLGPDSPLEEHRALLAIVGPLILLSIGSTYLLYVPLSYLLPRLVRALIIDNSPDHALLIAGKSWYNIGSIIIVVVLAPIVEELVFRGFILRRWSVKWGLSRAIVASSIAFGVLHADVLGHTVFGIAMCFLYMRTGTLRMPIAVHALNNAAAMAIGLSSLGSAPARYTLADFRSHWWVGVVCYAIAVPLIAYLTRGYWNLRSWRLPKLTASA